MKASWIKFIGAGSGHHHKNVKRKLCLVVGVLLVFVGGQIFSVVHARSVGGGQSPGVASLVLSCVSSCDAVASQVESLGGTVSLRYANVNALAIKVPVGVADRVATIVGITGLGKDKLITTPYPFAPFNLNEHNSIEGSSINPAELDALVKSNPANYSFNNGMTGATTLHQAGHFGEGVVVAVIDSGIANPIIVNALYGNVVGGENFVDGVGEPSATSTFNDSHGTWVASMIAGHGSYNAMNSDPLVQAVMAHAPDSVLPLNPFASTIPMVGTAPAASLYALKIFPADGGGAWSSATLAAMDRALTLKRNFDAGQPVVPVSGTGHENDPFVYDALNIRVVNMSLGGDTLIPGLDLEDVLIHEMLASGITVVTSTGNEGPASFTGGSPGTSAAALTVGATSSAKHERIWLDTVVEPGFGGLYRASDALQVAEFCSRGPTAGGKRGIDVVANGLGSFAQGADGFVYFVSGTSFAAPTVAGAAALLMSANPSASATEVRSALIKSANDDLLKKSASRIDQGRGFLDVAAALKVLNNGKASRRPPTLPRKPRRSREIEDLIERFGMEPIELDDDESYSVMVDLVPGEVEHLLVPADDETAAITVTVTDIQAELPFDQQNVFYGDDIFLTVVDAPTSYSDVLASEFLFADTQLVFDDPQHGFVRLAVMGDFTNAGKVRAKITISEQEQESERALIKQRIKDGQFDSYFIAVEPGTTSVNFELSWKGDWSRFPTNDLDLILVDPDNNVFFDGATLRIPEKAQIANPVAGVWNVIVDGYQLHGLRDKYELRAFDATGQALEVMP